MRVNMFFHENAKEIDFTSRACRPHVLLDVVKPHGALEPVGYQNVAPYLSNLGCLSLFHHVLPCQERSRVIKLLNQCLRIG
ncbi:uncharacterized [Tachysurus ichikawai]